MTAAFRMWKILKLIKVIQRNRRHTQLITHSMEFEFLSCILIVIWVITGTKTLILPTFLSYNEPLSLRYNIKEPGTGTLTSTYFEKHIMQSTFLSIVHFTNFLRHLQTHYTRQQNDSLLVALFNFSKRNFPSYRSLIEG